MDDNDGLVISKYSDNIKRETAVKDNLLNYPDEKSDYTGYISDDSSIGFDTSNVEIKDEYLVHGCSFDDTVNDSIANTEIECDQADMKNMSVVDSYDNGELDSENMIQFSDIKIISTEISYSNVNDTAGAEYVSSKRGKKAHSRLNDTIQRIKVELEIHKSKHEDSIKMPSCDICNYETPSTTEFLKHLQMHIDRTPDEASTGFYVEEAKKASKRYRCCQCNYSAANLDDITNHVNHHLTATSMSSESSDAELSAKRKYVKAKDKQLYKCDECDFKSSKKSIFSKHGLKHSLATLCKCSVCPEYSSSTVLNLKKHLATHNALDNAMYMCVKCNFSTKKDTNLSRHFLNADKEMKLKITSTKCEFSCQNCSYSCDREDQLEDHSKQHFVVENLQCDQCDYTCKMKSALRRHMNSHKLKIAAKKTRCRVSDTKPFKCDECSFSTRLRKVLDDHMNTHNGQQPYSCPNCEFKTTHENLLKKHELKHREKEKQPYLCTECGKVFSSAGTLRNHSDVHSGIKRFQCSLCKYACNHKSHLNQHVEAKHAKEKLLLCSACDFTTNWRNTLRQHMLKHLPNPPEHKCELCGYSSHLKSILNAHMKTHKRLNTAACYGCDVCDFTAAYEANLKDHMNKHLGLKPYSCTVCPYTTTHASNLKFHMRKHQDKKFKCDQCLFETPYSKSLRTHKLSHSDDRPIQCQVCEFRTKTASILKHHMIKHTGIKPFVCVHCDFSCTHKTYLVTHLQKNTTDKFNVCEFCSFRTLYKCALRVHMMLSH